MSYGTMYHHEWDHEPQAEGGYYMSHVPRSKAITAFLLGHRGETAFQNADAFEGAPLGLLRRDGIQSLHQHHDGMIG